MIINRMIYLNYAYKPYVYNIYGVSLDRSRDRCDIVAAIILTDKRI